MIEKLGTKGNEHISMPAWPVLRMVEELKKGGSRITVAEVGLGIGATTSGVAHLLDKGDEFYIFDFEDVANELARDLANCACNIRPMGNSRKKWDSYAWSLAQLKIDGHAGFDLAFLDGSHCFLFDAPACCLLKDMLRPGGFLILDDMFWSYNSSTYNNPRRQPSIREFLTDEQLAAPHVEIMAKIFLDGDSAFKRVNLEGSSARYGIWQKCGQREMPQKDAPEKAACKERDKESSHFPPGKINKAEKFLVSSLEKIGGEKLLQTAPQEVWRANPVWTAIRALQKSGIYDTEDYLRRYPDVQKAGMDAIDHYLRHGLAEGRELKARKADIPQKPQICRQGSFGSFYAMPLHVNWALTYMCNYQCSYCFGNERLDKRRFSSLTDLEAAVDNIAALNRDACNFTFTGGEPSIHPHFFELLEMLAAKLGERLDYVVLISNGSRQGSLYARLAEISNNININLMLSLHMEYLEEDHIMELIDGISDKMCLNFNFMYHPGKREYSRKLHESLCAKRREKAFNLSNTLLRGGRNFDVIDSRYNEDDFAWHRQAVQAFSQAEKAGPAKTPWKIRHRHLHKLFWDYARNGKYLFETWEGADRSGKLRDGFFNFHGKYCVIGSTELAIMPDGLAHGAQNCGQAPKKYNIFRENPYLRDDFIQCVKCAKENCGCSANDLLPKFESKAEAESFAASFARRQRERMAGK